MATDKNLYILGAGFSAFAGLPMIGDFLDKMKSLYEEKPNDAGGIDYRVLEETIHFQNEIAKVNYRMDVDLDNIEELLSIAEYAALESGSEIANTVKTAVAETLLAYTRMYLYSEDRKRLDYYLNFVINLFPNPDGVICFNYDTILEDVLYTANIRSAKMETKSPEFEQIANQFAWSYGFDNELYHPISRRPDLGLSIHPLLKLHGSVNWFQCPKHDLVYTAGLSASTQPGKCPKPECDQRTTPLIIPPTWNKTIRLGGERSILEQIWSRALQELRDAHRIVIIGYSMPLSDLCFKHMLSYALSNNEKLRTVVVVNPSRDAKNHFGQYFSSRFKQKRLKVIQIHFQDLFDDKPSTFVSKKAKFFEAIERPEPKEMVYQKYYKRLEAI